jgi:ketosteroid isomerase-like protein
MKRFAIAAFAVAMMLSGWAFAQKAGSKGRPDEAAVKKQVMELEDSWLDAMKNDKSDEITHLFSDALISTDSDGKVENKAGVLNEMHQTKFTAAANTEMKVSVFGNTAIATGVYTAAGTGTDGKKFDTRERFTDTWVRMRDGKFLLVATHTSNIKK